MKNKSISVIIPCFNEEDNLPLITNKLLNYFDENDRWASYKLVIVDDCSQDRTLQVAKDLVNAHSNIDYIHNTTNLNLGGIFQKMIHECNSDYFIMIQGQNAISEESLHKILDCETDSDLIIPFQENTRERAFMRRIISKLFTLILNLTFFNRIKYFNHYVLARTELLKTIDIKTSSYAFQAEIIIKLLNEKASYKEIPVRDVFSHKTKSSAFKIKNVLGVMSFYLNLVRDVYFTTSRRALIK